MSVINLEIEDYHRTIESLQGKINEKDKELSENTTQITKMNTDMDELKRELGRFGSFNHQHNSNPSSFFKGGSALMKVNLGEHCICRYLRGFQKGSS